MPTEDTGERRAALRQDELDALETHDENRRRAEDQLSVNALRKQYEAKLANIDKLIHGEPPWRRVIEFLVAKLDRESMLVVVLIGVAALFRWDGYQSEAQSDLYRDLLLNCQVAARQAVAPTQPYR